MSREGTGRQVVVAKSAGFCFGVERAVDQVYQQIDALKAGKAKGPIYTFGPIIHNEEVVKDLEEKGVMVLEDEAALRSLPKGQGAIRDGDGSEKDSVWYDKAGRFLLGY